MKFERDDAYSFRDVLRGLGEHDVFGASFRVLSPARDACLVRLAVGGCQDQAWCERRYELGSLRHLVFEDRIGVLDTE